MRITYRPIVVQYFNSEFLQAKWMQNAANNAVQLTENQNKQPLRILRLF